MNERNKNEASWARSNKCSEGVWMYQYLTKIFSTGLGAAHWELRQALTSLDFVFNFPGIGPIFAQMKNTRSGVALLLFFFFLLTYFLLCNVLFWYHNSPILMALPQFVVNFKNIPLPFLLLQVVILYFQPSVFRCILLRWVRLLGFATVYGTLTLKLYR